MWVSSKRLKAIEERLSQVEDNGGRTRVFSYAGLTWGYVSHGKIISHILDHLGIKLQHVPARGEDVVLIKEDEKWTKSTKSIT